MQLTEDLIVRVLEKNLLTQFVGLSPVRVITETDLHYVAQQILSVAQPNSSTKPQSYNNEQNEQLINFLKMCSTGDYRNFVKMQEEATALLKSINCH